MNDLIGSSKRVLDPIDRISEVLFGLIMVLTFTGSLIVIVIFSGYENFVSKIQHSDHEDWPEWMSKIDFSGLKIRVTPVYRDIAKGVDVSQGDYVIAALARRAQSGDDFPRGDWFRRGENERLNYLLQSHGQSRLSV